MIFMKIRNSTIEFITMINAITDLDPRKESIYLSRCTSMDLCTPHLSLFVSVFFMLNRHPSRHRHRLLLHRCYA